MPLGTTIRSGVIIIVWRKIRSSRDKHFSCGVDAVDDGTVSMSLLLPFLLLVKSTGVHQYVGYLRCILFKSSDVSRVKVVESSTSGRRYQPSCCTVGSMAASSAVAPAGGYIVFVKVMTPEAAPHARPPASHLRSSKLSLRVNSLVMPIPTAVARRCPMTVLRGCARGDSMVLYSRIAAAP